MQDDIVEICRKHNLKLILDAAHMAGTRIKGTIPRTEADAVVYSFQAVSMHMRVTHEDAVYIVMQIIEYVKKIIRIISWRYLRGRMKKIFLWGIGAAAEDNKEVIKSAYSMGIEILGFIDNSIQKVGKKFLGICIYPPEILCRFENPIVVVCSYVFFDEIAFQIRNDFPQKDCLVYDFRTFFGPIILSKIRQNIKTDDPERALKLEGLEGAQFDAYFPNIERNISKHYVMYDEGFPYIEFEGKRMYYPKGTRFCKEEDQEYVKDILREQTAGSPHEYLNGKWKSEGYRPNDVIVDAGVCEGNFSLRYVEEASHVYLIEPDAKWDIPLKMTFSPWKEKITFCRKYLSDSSGENSVSLDELIEENHVNFLKMDIEGFETRALMGGKSILKRGISKSAVCAYHKKDARREIEKIFKQNGYDTSVSSGYMFFQYDIDEFVDFELRRGIVYAER